MKPMKNKKSFALIFLAALWTLLSCGCNTVSGAGKDIERAGDKIQDAASRNR